MAEIPAPIVADQLQPFLDELQEQRPDVVPELQRTTLDDLRELTESMRYEVRGGYVGVIEPADGERSGTDLIWITPHQQALKPSIAARAKVLHAVVAPNSRLIVLPNPSVTDKPYGLDAVDVARTRSGDIRPYAELMARRLSSLGVERALLTGYSFGAVGSLAIASAWPDFEIAGINADEAPHKPGRTAKGLSYDFRHSGGPKEQLAAVRDSGIVGLQEALARGRLMLDYARFGVATVTNETNGALVHTMTGDCYSSLALIDVQCRLGALKLGHVLGSRMFDGAVTRATRVVEYSGDGTHAHPTGDNPFNLALMTYDGLKAVL